MSRFTESLVVTPLPDGKTWIILNDFGHVAINSIYDIFVYGSILANSWGMKK